MSGVRVGRHLDAWGVTCSACEEGLWSFFRPWALGKTWAAAMVLAQWHASLHAEQRCPTCLHEPPLPRPETMSGDPTLFRWNGRLWRLAGDRVVEMTAGTPSPHPPRRRA